MDYARFAPLLEWLAAAGLSGQREVNLLQGFCERAVAAGLPLGRAVFGVDTLHPVLEGRVFYWERDAGSPVQSEYGRLDPERSEDKWLQSPFHQLYETGETTLRQRLANEPLPFPVLEELRQRGMTDYVAMVNRFGAEGAIGLMDCTYSSWASDRPSGFDTDDLAALEFLVPSLALAIKGASTAHIIETLVETYLGRDAGHRVLSGHIQRGVAEKISAVLWFSDLQGFTRITDTAPPEHLVPLLNDYADAIVSALRGEGGEVLKFMGDGILAIFDAAAPQDACRQALDAAADAIRRVGALNQRRAADGPARHPLLSRPARRRGVLRQHRQLRPARLHRGRPRGQRDQPHRRHVPLARSGRAAVLRLRGSGGPEPAPPGLGRPLRAARRAASPGAVHARSRGGRLTSAMKHSRPASPLAAGAGLSRCPRARPHPRSPSRARRRAQPAAASPAR